MCSLTKIEAAMKLGVSVELIEYFTKKCPKPNENIKLSVEITELGEMYDETKLIEFNNYLNKPWAFNKNNHRPSIPKAIEKDIKQESYYSCAICGYMDNGEVAHIDAVSDTMNNSPDNLIFLCPNHHTKYDYGYKLNSNITKNEVKAAKLLKRNSRCRILKYEANATKYLFTIIKYLQIIKSKLEEINSDNLINIYLAEMKGITRLIPELIKKAHMQASKDKFVTKTEQVLAKHAPELTKLVNLEAIENSNKELRNTVDSLISHTSKIIIDIDEIDCPHCGGSGQTGRVGDICIYCGGSCVVSHEKSKSYDRNEIDEIECPHCGGSGQTGRVGDICTYCGGSCVVSNKKFDEYDRGKINEIDCPHCGGSGQTGRVGDVCAYCGGSCVVSHEKSKSYDRNEIDEIECPHCGGSSQTGRVGDICTYCGGSCVVSNKKFDEYDRGKINEIDCPHCGGSGQTGRVGDVCAYCGGSCVVSHEKSKAYDRNEIDEIECPHCGGNGQTGREGGICALCNGSCVVSNEIATAYYDKNGGN